MSGHKKLTDQEARALEDIKGYARANRVSVARGHGSLRMVQRRVQIGDIIHALSHASDCRLQPNGRWKVTGKDLDGDDLSLVVLLEDEVVVVTVF